MIALFTIPKPFRGHVAVIQRNAIQSWLQLKPACEIILFGDEEGTAEIAGEMAVRHVPEVKRNEYGTPLVNDVFYKAQSLAKTGFLCYVNADIILISDFMEAVELATRQKGQFLIVGRRWDVDIDESWDFNKSDWEKQLREHVRAHGKLHSPTGIDYFVFPKGFWKDIPQFAIGRTVWDNWLIYQARSLGATVIDATSCITAIHQNHDYSHLVTGKIDAWKGPESIGNLEMAGGYAHVFTLEDATHILTPSGPKLDLSLSRLRRHLHTLLILSPHLRPLRRFLRVIAKVLRLLWLRLELTPNHRRSNCHDN